MLLHFRASYFLNGFLCLMTISELIFHTAPEHCVLAAVVCLLESSWMQLGVPVQWWWWIHPQWQVFDCRPWLEAALLLGELSLPSWQYELGSPAFLSLWTHTHKAELKWEHSSMQIAYAVRDSSLSLSKLSTSRSQAELMRSGWSFTLYEFCFTWHYLLL